MNQELTVLIVDDSLLYRRFVKDALSKIPGVTVIGFASNGENALIQISALRPDIVILDIHMPSHDGIDVLRHIKDMENRPAVIVLAARTESSIEKTTAALKLGAFDFIFKPEESSPDINHRVLFENLEQRIEALRRSDIGDLSDENPMPNSVPVIKPSKSSEVDVVVIGTSTGGPSALFKVIPHIPAEFELPILVVQHMPPLFTDNLAKDLNKVSALTVLEGAKGAQVQSGHVYIAPGGMQMKVFRTLDGTFLDVNDDSPENHCKPSVDYLLRSVASTYGGRTLSVIMTGMGADGTIGCGLVANQGGRIITQNAESCVVYGMPRNVDEAGLSCESCDLETIAVRITEAGRKKELKCQP